MKSSKVLAIGLLALLAVAFMIHCAQAQAMFEIFGDDDEK